MVRKRLFRLLFALVLPVRVYLAYGPSEKGKDRLYRLLLRPLLPPRPCTFRVELPTNGVVDLEYRETIGVETLLLKNFERAESLSLVGRTVPGTVAIDIGANIGYHTVQLAFAVGHGQVMAFEPFPENVSRLKQNLRLNDLTNVEVYPVAVSDREDDVALYVASDPGWHSTMRKEPGRELTINVHCVQLDAVWRAAGAPEVSVLKVDVEGGELYALRGALQLIEQCKPTILVEAKTDDDLADVRALLEGFDYSEQPNPAFAWWNHLFVRQPRQEPG